MVNYGTGGYYTVHHDKTTASLQYDRFAPFLMYLTDVQEGSIIAV